MREANQPRSECPINAAIEVFGDRWSLIVLRDIVFGDRRYFRELQANSIEGIASNILADRLKRLVKSGLLTREDTRPGQRARYSLTEPAIQLVPVFAQLGSWGLRHRPTSSALNARAKLLEQGGPALWQEFMHELRRSHLGSESPARSPSARPYDRTLQRCQPVREEPADLIGPFLLDPVTASGSMWLPRQVRQGIGKGGDGSGLPHGRAVLLPFDEQGRNPDRRASPRLEVLPATRSSA